MNSSFYFAITKIEKKNKTKAKGRAIILRKINSMWNKEKIEESRFDNKNQMSIRTCSVFSVAFLFHIYSDRYLGETFCFCLSRTTPSLILLRQRAIYLFFNFFQCWLIPKQDKTI